MSRPNMPTTQMYAAIAEGCAYTIRQQRQQFHFTRLNYASGPSYVTVRGYGQRIPDAVCLNQQAQWNN